MKYNAQDVMRQRSPSAGIFRLYLWGAALLTACALADQTNQTAELRVTQFELCPYYLTNALPISGMTVDENPPFLFGPERGVSRASDNYYFRLSQDQTFTSNVITSTPRRWSFYSPYQPLAQGKWYWQYAHMPTGSVAALSWSATMDFTIAPEAWTNSAPAFSVLTNSLIAIGNPRWLCSRPDIGHLMPQDAALSNALSTYFSAVLSKTPTSAIPKYPVVNGVRDQVITSVYSTYVRPAWIGYVLTGDERYKTYASNAIPVMEADYAQLVQASELSDTDAANYKAFRRQLYDVLRDVLTEEQRQDIRNIEVSELYAWFLQKVNGLDREELNEHDWQMDMIWQLEQAIIFYDPADVRAREVLEYLYDHWNFRGPIGGRTDGGWVSGSGYMNAHDETIFFYPAILSKYTGTDFFDRPWYKNVPFYTAYLRAGNHGDSVSDKGSSGFASLNDYYRCLQIMRPGDPLVYREWLLRSGRFITLSDITYEKQAWLTLPWLHQQPQPSTNEPLPALPAKTHVFRDTGIALLFNQTTNLDSAVRAAFHSRPYGVVGHGHPGNNTFNLTYGGKPVFTGTGHYSESYDRFALRNYKHSRAKNGILPYGNVCEGLDTSGYGWIARHLEGDRISYSLGDASQSFSGSYRIHERNLANAEIPLTLEAGYGNPGVTRYRRHLALLDNGTLVLYDELAAQTAIPWTFQLNSVTPMVKINNHTVASTCPNGFAVAEVFCEQPLQTSITDQFVGDIKDMASLYNRARWEVSNHWHASLAVTNGQQTLRFLTLIHRVQNGQPMVQSVENLSADGRKVVSAGGWSVEAEMDGSRPGYLKIWNSAGTSALVSGPAATNLQLGAAGCTAKLPGSTILMEQGQAVKEAIDVLPDILRYGNIY